MHRFWLGVFLLSIAGCANARVAEPYDAGSASDASLDEVETARGCRWMFPDIARHPARMEIEVLARACDVRGLPSGEFNPDGRVTRAQFAAIVVSAFDERAVSNARLSDVPSGVWYERPVRQALAAGYMRGFPDGTFRPNDPITREQALVSIVSGRRLRSRESDDPIRPVDDLLPLWRRFDDHREVSQWALGAVAIAIELGALDNERLINRVAPRRLRPRDAASRAEVASFVFHLQY